MYDGAIEELYHLYDEAIEELYCKCDEEEKRKRTGREDDVGKEPSQDKERAPSSHVLAYESTKSTTSLNLLRKGGSGDPLFFVRYGYIDQIGTRRAMESTGIKRWEGPFGDGLLYASLGKIRSAMGFV